MRTWRFDCRKSFAKNELSVSELTLFSARTIVKIFENVIIELILESFFSLRLNNDEVNLVR